MAHHLDLEVGEGGLQPPGARAAVVGGAVVGNNEERGGAAEGGGLVEEEVDDGAIPTKAPSGVGGEHALREGPDRDPTGS